MELSFGIFNHISLPNDSVSKALRTSLPLIRLELIGNDETQKAFAEIAQVFMKKLKALVSLRLLLAEGGLMHVLGTSQYGKLHWIVFIWRRWFHQNNILIWRKWYAVIIARN